MGNKQSSTTFISPTKMKYEEQSSDYVNCTGDVIKAQCSGSAVVLHDTVYCSDATQTTICNLHNNEAQNITGEYHSAYARACICNNYFILPSSDYTEPMDTRLFAMDLQTNKWSVLPARGKIPHSRANSCAAAVKNSHIVIFGGYASNVNYSNDMHQYSMAMGQWEPVQNQGAAIPSARCAFAHAYCEETCELWIHGGTTDGSDRLDDVWKFSFYSRQWTCVVPVASFPNPRTAVLHSMSFHGMDRLFICAKEHELDEYDISRNKWIVHKVTSKTQLLNHSIASYQDKLLFCGHSGIFSVRVGEARRFRFTPMQDILFAKQKKACQTDITIITM